MGAGAATSSVRKVTHYKVTGQAGVAAFASAIAITAVNNILKSHPVPNGEQSAPSAPGNLFLHLVSTTSVEFCFNNNANATSDDFSFSVFEYF